MKKNTHAAKKTTAAETVRNITAWAAIGCIVAVTPPPEWQKPERKYWQVCVKGQDGKLYSAAYRMKDSDAAQALAEKIAGDRGLQVVHTEPPKGRPVIHPPEKA